MPKGFSALILSAGNSGRMGTDKAMLPNGKGLTFVAHLATCFGLYGCNPVVVVVNEQFDPSRLQTKNIVTVVNHDLEKGRSWSIRLGLNQIPEGHACFIQNIDNPFLEPDLLDSLIGCLIPDGYAVPVWHGHGGHPILLGNKLVDFLRNQKELPDFRKALQFYTRIEVQYPEEGILWNINTPEDYNRFIHGPTKR